MEFSSYSVTLALEIDEISGPSGAFEQHLKKSGNFDWYLMILAVSPTVQGQGLVVIFPKTGLNLT